MLSNVIFLSIWIVTLRIKVKNQKLIPTIKKYLSRMRKEIWNGRSNHRRRRIIYEMITYRKITSERSQDLLLPNEPFVLDGKLIVSRINNQWSYETIMHENNTTMTFPNENYTFEDIDKKGFAVGAYRGEMCVGIAIYEFNWNRFLYLMDLKVNSQYRKKGIASELIKVGQHYAEELEYQGLYTIAQDNNLAACKFYLKQNFVIGGLNTMDYHHTSQQGKADIYFYKSF